MWRTHPADPCSFSHHRQPDFLVISPPKTGSTWLAANLRSHPQLFVPEVKEVKYFSSLYKCLDFGWYCDHFAPAGNRRAGEASPSYASLPLASIRHIRRLLPDIKLVFLMRDPVARAWSHAKHNHRYQEANFALNEPESDTVTDDQWRANFVHDWPLVSGDYLGQLRRWSSVFPREQLFVGLYESIVNRPADLLRGVFEFLGVEPGVDLSKFPIGERILAGPSGDLSTELAPFLRGLLASRTEELTEFLRREFGLEVPDKWQTTLGLPRAPQSQLAQAFRLESDDNYLSRVVQLEETFASGSRRVLTDYRGYDIVFSRGKLHGVARERAAVPGAFVDCQAIDSIPNEQTLVASTLAELKELITTQALADANRRVRAIEHELRAVQEHLSRMAADLSEVVAASRRPSSVKRLFRALRASARRAGLHPRARSS